MKIPVVSLSSNFFRVVCLHETAPHIHVIHETRYTFLFNLSNLARTWKRALCLYHNDYCFFVYSKVVRKSIARVMTVISQTQRDNLRKFYRTKKYKPLDLRIKTTRAQRRALSKHDASRKTLRQVKRETHFGVRKFAVKE